VTLRRLRFSRTEERHKKPWGFNPWRSVTEAKLYGMESVKGRSYMASAPLRRLLNSPKKGRGLRGAPFNRS
jgi:hypothetical protein